LENDEERFYMKHLVADGDFGFVLRGLLDSSKDVSIKSPLADNDRADDELNFLLDLP